MISEIGQTSFIDFTPDYFTEERCNCQEYIAEIENKQNCKTNVFIGITIFLQLVVIVSEIYILYLALQLK